MALSSRRALPFDADQLGLLNHQLIRDEGHHNPMTVLQLQERMRGWLAAEYTAVLLKKNRNSSPMPCTGRNLKLIHLRQLFVQRHCRRKGFGQEALRLLRSEIWPARKRLTVEVLSSNSAALSFYRAAGFREYCVTLEIPANHSVPPAKNSE